MKKDPQPVERIYANPITYWRTGYVNEQNEELVVVPNYTEDNEFGYFCCFEGHYKENQCFFTYYKSIKFVKIKDGTDGEKELQECLTFLKYYIPLATWLTKKPSTCSPT